MQGLLDPGILAGSPDRFGAHLRAMRDIIHTTGEMRLKTVSLTSIASCKFKLETYHSNLHGND